MTDRFTSLGKEVMLNGKHYADAVSPLAAELIAEAMNHRTKVARERR